MQCINHSSDDKAAAKAELDSLNAYYQQCKRIYQKELSEKKESIAALNKKIQEKESERNEAQEELGIYLLSGKDGLKKCGKRAERSNTFDECCNFRFTATA